MPKIVIKEYDETTPGVTAESNEVVYVPGCVDDTQASLYGDNGEYKGLEPNVPTLFTNVADFEALCGSSGLKFTRDWDYRELTYVSQSGIAPAFSSDAVPFHKVIFGIGTVDPGYVMAKELLAAGLNVVYERINSSDVFEEVTPSTISDWSAVYKEHFTDLTLLDLIKEANVPTTFEIPDPNGKKPEDTIPRQIYSFTAKTNIDGICLADGKKSSSKLNFTDGTAVTLSNFLFPRDLLTEVSNYPDVSSGSVYDVMSSYYIDEVDGDKTIKKEQTLEELQSAKYLAESEGKLTFTAAAEGKVFYLVKTYTYRNEDMAEGTSIKLNVLPNSSVSVDGNDYVIIESADLYLVQPQTTGTGSDIKEYVPVDWTTNYWKTYFELTTAEKVNCTASDLTGTSGCTEYGNTIKYYAKLTGVQLDKVYDALSLVYDGEFDEDTGFTSGLADKGNYNIKYITSGGYPVYEYAANSVVNKMIALAAKRGDCYALIDHTDNLGRSTNINDDESIFKSVNRAAIEDAEYAAMFTPWATYTRVTSDKLNGKIDDTAPLTFRMPASYAYLQALADSINTNAPWLAVAGAARGGVKYLAEGGMTTVISNGVADAMQPRSNGVSINAITNIKPYGQTIWGNRTLKKNEDDLVATSFLNIRNLVCDVKKQAYRAARALTFEQDNEVLWINFKSKIAPTLDRMLSGYGISGYKIVRNTEHERAKAKATVCARIILYPTYAVEDFYIDIVLRDSEVTVESNG